MSRHLLKISRLEALTDGIFAIAMTILALDLRMPASLSLLDLHTVFMQLILMKLFIYVGSFVTLGTLWVAMNFQLGFIDHLNRPYLWANIFYLMVICVIPFSASFLAIYPNSALSIEFYACNLLFAYVGQFLTIQCSHVFKLNKDSSHPALRFAVVRRILIAPIFIFMAIIAAQWNTVIAFGLLLLPTLLYIFPGKVDKFEAG